MHSKGTLTTWKDEQGFGFATTEQQTDKVLYILKILAIKPVAHAKGINWSMIFRWMPISALKL